MVVPSCFDLAELYQALKKFMAKDNIVDICFLFLTKGKNIDNESFDTFLL